MLLLQLLMLLLEWLFIRNVSIDLSGNSSGEYLIEITSDGMLLEGIFTL